MAVRLDALLVQKNIAPSREEAKELIKNGQISVNNKLYTKPSREFEETSEIVLTGEVLKYVGRGGLKLEKALDYFKIYLENKVCADIGASTGGFTDCMLMNGADKVYSVDVGHDQLAEKLKNDSRVVNLEGVNVRYLTDDNIPQKIDFMGIDVSFISLTLILPVLKDFLKDNGEMVCLIKPQFEAGKALVGKKGVVKSQKTHFEVLDNILNFIKGLGFNIIDLTYSPIKGPEGNIEYLIYLKNSQSDYLDKLIGTNEIVADAFNSLKNI